MNVDTLLVNATFLTQDPSIPRAEALAVAGGRIVAVGGRDDVEPLASRSTARIDLEGATALPGFNDAHVHVWKVGQMLTSIVDLRAVDSLDALALVVRERSRTTTDDSWVIGRGYNEAIMAEGRQPTVRDLDRAVSDRPVALTRTCGHMMVVNSRALELAGVGADTPDPAGGVIVRDESGNPTGLLQETAMGLAKAVMPSPSVADYAEMVRAANRSQLQKGITSATDAGAYPDLLAAYRDLEASRDLMVRINAMSVRLADEEAAPYPLPEHFVSEFLRVDSVKLFADGGLSGGTAALSRPYRNLDGRGLLRVEESELVGLGRESRRAGFRVCTHAIGDRAIDTVLNAYGKFGGRENRIEHFGLPDRDQIERARRLGTIVVPQTIFIRDLGANFRRYLTEEYLERCYPVRSMLDAGLVVALSSDAPVVPDDDPLLGVHAAVTRLDRDGVAIAPQEAITAEEAIYAYTMGGAIASGDAENRGSLTRGKWADLVVLDRSPLDVSADEIPGIEVRRTYVGGQLAYEA
jgi:predicted amidohydrolase YtcJ